MCRYNIHRCTCSTRPQVAGETATQGPQTYHCSFTSSNLVTAHSEEATFLCSAHGDSILDWEGVISSWRRSSYQVVGGRLRADMFFCRFAACEICAQFVNGSGGHHHAEDVAGQGRLCVPRFEVLGCCSSLRQSIYLAAPSTTGAYFT